MIQYVISFLIFLFLLIASPAGAAAQAGTGLAKLSLEPASGTFNKGCDFSLNIKLDTDQAQTDGTDSILVYDVTRLTALSITNGTIYKDYPGSNIDAATGRVTISGLASVTTPYAGKGVLATVNFKVNDTAATGTTQVAFDFTPGSTIDSNVVERDTVTDLLTSVVNGSYTIGTGACTDNTQSPSPSSSKAPFSSSRPGGGPNSTDSATPLETPSPTEQAVLPPAGTEQFTFAVAIFGGVLTVLGILGLALL